MKIIGVTGGIGSGKSVVCNVLEVLGYPVYYADNKAKMILDLPEVQQIVLNQFGSEVFSSGKVDRKKMAQVVFSDAHKLNQLNAIIHPAVQQDFEKWCSRQKSNLVFKEAAILFETGGDKKCTATVLVVANESLRKKRVVKRDGRPEEEVMGIMNKQWSDDQKMALADYVLYNTNEPLLQQILDLVEELEC